MISRFFIDRPVFAAVISIVIVLAGFMAMRALPIEQYPEIVPPQVVVSASYPGASPEVLAVIENVVLSSEALMVPCITGIVSQRGTEDALMDHAAG